jgi:hypothetical protein
MRRAEYIVFHVLSYVQVSNLGYLLDVFSHYPLLWSLSFSSQPVRSHLLFRYGAVTKAYISGRDKSVLFIVYNATWINDENTGDSLLILQRAQEVGITVSTEDPSEESAMRIGNEVFPFQNNTR